MHYKCKLCFSQVEIIKPPPLGRLRCSSLRRIRNIKSEEYKKERNQMIINLYNKEEWSVNQLSIAFDISDRQIYDIFTTPVQEKQWL